MADISAVTIAAAKANSFAFFARGKGAEEGLYLLKLQHNCFVFATE